MTPNNPPPGPSEAALSSIVVNSGYGGLHATILSAFALVLSAFSLYEASFKTADLEIFIPPVIQYGRDGGGDTELFVVPTPSPTRAHARAPSCRWSFPSRI